ncbi:MAG: hypothetical protein SV760_03515 [Halobacteria archaeon]|nr:hypothetical protein [Halobacteria archaeon]
MSEQDDVEVFNKVVSDELDQDYVIETPHGTITYSIVRPDRSRRFEFIESLPDELVEMMMEQDQAQRREANVDEAVEQLTDLDDLSEAEPDQEVNPKAMTKDAVDEMEDFIVEHFRHDQLTDRETRELLEYWPDEQFFATSYLILAIAADTEGVSDFRLE